MRRAYGAPPTSLCALPRRVVRLACGQPPTSLCHQPASVARLASRAPQRPNQASYLCAAQRVAPTAEVLDVFRGSELVGLVYTGPFDDLPAQEGAEHRVVAWDQVGEDEGTGVVHIAPGCGAEDFELAKEWNLPVLAPLDEDGKYVDGYGVLAGTSFSDAVAQVCAQLSDRELLHQTEEYPHRYPHCWRCGMEALSRVLVVADADTHRAMDDRIGLTYQAPGSVARALEQRAEHICAETLCVEMKAGEVQGGVACRINGEVVNIDLRRVR